MTDVHFRGAILIANIEMRMVVKKPMVKKMNDIKRRRDDLRCTVLRFILDFNYIERFEDIADGDIDDIVCDLKPNFENIREQFNCKKDDFDYWYDWFSERRGGIKDAVTIIHKLATITKESINKK